MTRVAVVGAGPVGSAAARHLSLESDEVVLVGPEEPADFRTLEGAWSGSYDAGRICHTLDLPLLSSVIGLRSRRRFADLQRRTGVRFTDERPYLTVFPGGPGAAGPAEGSGGWGDMDAQRTNAADLRVPFEELDAAALQEQYPRIRFQTGHAGLLQPDGMLINPRGLVRAEAAAAVAGGVARVTAEVTRLREVPSGMALELANGDTLYTDKVLLAAGAYINASGLSPRPLAFGTFGCTIVLVPALEPERDFGDFPILMYYQASGNPPFRGIILPPLEYPDGHRYVKTAGDSVAKTPLDGFDHIRSWVRTGGRAEDIDQAVRTIEDLVPGRALGKARTRPCLVTMNETGQAYVDLLHDRLAVVTEGEHGVTMADELGRLGARLLLDGEWRDTLPHEPFRARFAA